MRFDLGPGLKCDLQKLIDTRALIQANSGGGKSHTLRRLLEQTHGRVQQLVIDPEGEFASLRERYDYVLAARNSGDTAADPRAAKLLAERLLQLGVSAILDIYELKAHERIRFVRHFLEALVDAPKKLWHPALVVVDEAHVYCPQQGEAESAGAVIDLCTRGRKRGFSAILATQRLSKLHKDAAAELNNKLIGRTGLDVDRKRAGEELGFTTKEQLLSLRQLEPGHFYAFGPALSLEVMEVQVGPVQTTHPKAGSRIAFTPPPPTEKVRALLPQLADLPAEAEQKQKTEAELRKELAAARATISRLERGAPARVETKVEPKIERVEVPILTTQHLKELHAAVTVLRTIFGETTKLAEELVTARSSLAAAAQRIEAAVTQAGDRARAAARVPGAPVGRVHTSGIAAATPRPARPPRPASPPGEVTEGIGNVEQKILDQLAQLEAIGLTPTDKQQLGFFAGYTNIRSGGFSEPMGRLLRAGLIAYTRPGTVVLTDAGRTVARPSDGPATTDALQERILAKINGPRAKLLRELITLYPSTISKAELGERCGYTNIRSGGFSEPLGSLRTLGLVEYPTPGEARAADALFLEEAHR